jgi:uncharacterized protein with HEPN domain
MRRDPKAFLWDARDAAEAVTTFIRDKSFNDLTEDRLLRSAVERQLEIIGEALSQLAKSDPEIAAKVPRLREIIAFRNILVHGYDSIDYENVWKIIHADLPTLVAALSALLGPEDATET